MAARVILADDHRIVREGLRSVLEGESAVEVVGETDNGRDTVAMAKELEPDIVIMDISMPDLNGVDATRKIVELGLPSRVLGLSAHTDEKFIKGMLVAGASGYLLKDCAGEELLLAIQTLVQGGVYVSPAVADLVVSDFRAHVSGTAVTDEELLSLREREVLQLIAEGKTTAAIAEALHVSVKTIETHRKNVMDKVGVRNVAGLTKYAIRIGLTNLEG